MKTMKSGSGLDYTIVVPSRRRSEKMTDLMELLPTAVICVDEREEDEYRKVVPAERLLLHPPMDGLPAVLNWMMDAIKTPILIEIDDDFRGVHATVSGRFITDPEEILAILENAARACQDLKLTTFCFSRTPNTSVIRPAERPVVPVQAVCHAFGIMGAARHRKYNLEFTGRADIDWALRTLLKDRCVLADVRYYFDGGPAFAGTGGNVGIVTPEQFSKASRLLAKKWGRSVSFKSPGYVKHRQVAPLRIAVTRTNSTGQR